MIAKILKSTSDFHAVVYNHNKMMKGKGELMAIENFSDLMKDNLSPSEVKKYLKYISEQNKRAKNPQFHATISAEGKSFSKEELTEIGKEWMQRMGYGDQPYIVVFHNDTDNNHIHLVSTRVSASDGKKINDSFERIRAVKNIEDIMQKLGHSKHISFLDYSFETKNQLKLIYERSGCTTKEEEGELVIYKNLQEQERIPFSLIEAKMQTYEIDKKRVAKLKALLHKYGKIHSGELRAVYQSEAGGRNKKIVGYSSDLADYMKRTFGVEMVFHFTGDKPPYGYTLIDHSEKTVMKGSAVMKLGLLQDIGYSAESENDLSVEPSEPTMKPVESAASLLSQFGGGGDDEPQRRQKKKR